MKNAIFEYKLYKFNSIGTGITYITGSTTGLTQTFTNLVGGINYLYTVKDSNNRIYTTGSTYYLESGLPLSITKEITDASNETNNNGSIKITVNSILENPKPINNWNYHFILKNYNGYIIAHYYSKNNIYTFESLSGNTQYYVDIEDSRGQKIIDENAYVNSTTSLNVLLTSFAPLPAGNTLNNNGSILVEIKYAKNPCKVVLKNETSGIVLRSITGVIDTYVFNNLIGGNKYSVTTTDAKNYTNISNTYVESSLPITVNTTVTRSNVESNDNAKIKINISGQPNYNISLINTNGNTTVETINDLTTNTYTFLNLFGSTTYVLNITDSRNYTYTENIFVDIYQLILDVIVTKTSLTTLGGSDATVKFDISGGKPIYNYKFYNDIKTISSGTTNDTFFVSGLTEGIYHTDIKDSITDNTTVWNQDIQIEAYTGLTFITGVTQPTNETDNNGTISLTVEHGNSDFIYKLYNINNLNNIIQSGATRTNTYLFTGVSGDTSYVISVDTNGKTGTTSSIYVPSGLLNIHYLINQELTIDGDATGFVKNNGDYLFGGFDYNLYYTDIDTNIFIVRSSVNDSDNTKTNNYYYVGYNNSTDETKIIQINTYNEKLINNKNYKFKIYDNIFNYFTQSFLTSFNINTSKWVMNEIITNKTHDLSEYNINSITIDNINSDYQTLNDDVINLKFNQSVKEPLGEVTVTFGTTSLSYQKINNKTGLYLKTIVVLNLMGGNSEIGFNSKSVCNYNVYGVNYTIKDSDGTHTFTDISFSDADIITHSIDSLGRLVATQYFEIYYSGTFRSASLQSTPYIDVNVDAINISINGDGNYAHIETTTRLDMNSTTTLKTTNLTYDDNLCNISNLINYKLNFEYNHSINDIFLFTKPITEVTFNTVKCGGYTFNPPFTLKTYGLCYSKDLNPTTTGETSIVSVIGSNVTTIDYEIMLMGLEQGCTYYIKAYAIDEKDNVYYGNEIMFNTFYEIKLTTENIVDITSSGATIGYRIIDRNNYTLSELGICYSMNEFPTINDEYYNLINYSYNTYNLYNLQPNTTYYVRAYAKNSNGVSYGDQKEFTTHPITFVNLSYTQEMKFIGNITNYTGTTSITNFYSDCYWNDISMNGSSLPINSKFITNLSENSTTNCFFDGVFTLLSQTNTFKVGIDIMRDNYNNFKLWNNKINYLENITRKSFSLPLTTNFILNDPKEEDTTVVLYDADINNSYLLNTENNVYLTASHYKVQCNYSLYIEPITLMLKSRIYTLSYNTITVNTDNCSDITLNSAICGGNVAYNGDDEIISRGVCWSTSINPTIVDYHTNDGTGDGYFISNLTNLNPNTTYYVRAYASTNMETIYGVEISFTTYSHIELTTTKIYNVALETATCEGYINNNGGVQLTNRGVCWSTSNNPSINNNHTNDGTSIGILISNLNGLIPDTIYYVRTFATNQFETVYGNEIKFETNGSVEVIIDHVDKISNTNAVCTSSIIDSGNQDIVMRGICWSTSHNPIIYVNNNVTNDGTQLGTIESTVDKLSYGETYYIRAYTISINNLIYYSNEVTYINV